MVECVVIEGVFNSKFLNSRGIALWAIYRDRLSPLERFKREKLARPTAGDYRACVIAVESVSVCTSERASVVRAATDYGWNVELAVTGIQPIDLIQTLSF